MECIAKIKDPNGYFVACGQCLPCRVQKRREWTGRMILETQIPGQTNNLFVTLTYNEQEIPYADSERQTLLPKDFKNFVKSLRRKGSFRFYGCGEYGENTGRPHYHLCIFAHPLFDPFNVAKVWKKGHVQVGLLNPQRIAYTAGYVTKKLTNSEDPRLEGRHPEFARMSQRPGIGHGYIERIARWYETRSGSAALARYGDVASTFKFGHKEYPLGTYLTKKLRERLDIPSSRSERAARSENYYQRIIKAR